MSKSSQRAKRKAVEYVQLKWIEKWDGKLPETYSGDTIPMVKLKK